jgi:7,8-dihydropterin-6-yl-methyl-4-(beta-D-ribofuranosyl)aminobenzene 5'-phosphate synthase
MATAISEVDKIEILTLQDNYVDLVSRDNTAFVTRAMPLKDMQVKNSILAEHGFSALVTVTKGDRSRSVLFDFGFSQHGAAFNTDALTANLGSVEALVLSHGHLDHVGGLEELVKRTGKKGLELILHPSAFRNPRYLKITEEFKVQFPPFTKEKAAAAGVSVKTSKDPLPLLDGDLLFLGGIPRTSGFEKGTPSLFYAEDGQEKWDDIADDTAIAANVRGKGLVVISGCSHAGIVNTVTYAQKVTGLNAVYAVMGGFHLTGADMEPVVEPTVAGLKKIDPAYIVPTHCTGRKAIARIEQEMPEKFVLNMSGTKLTFAA